VPPFSVDSIARGTYWQAAGVEVDILKFLEHNDVAGLPTADKWRFAAVLYDVTSTLPLGPVITAWS